MPLELGDANRDLVELVRSRQRLAEGEHRQFRDHAGEYYGLYRSFNDFRDQARATPDTDEVIRSAQRAWGAELFIPFAYSTVETILPRMIAHRPRILVLPRDEVALGNVEAMRLVMDSQQKQAQYETVLQVIAKDGLIYGLGVQKTRWKKEYKRSRSIVASQYDPEKFVEGDLETVCTYDDATWERVDPFNFYWDPYADSVESCEFVIHRSFRSETFVRRMVSAGHWRSVENDPSCEWDLEDMLRSVAKNKRDEIMQSRLTAEGYSTNELQGGGLHEVWEYHDGDRVITVLNDEIPVQVGENPSGTGTIPFQIYRPTVVGGRFPGVSEIEPIKHLQYEINTLRSQRRDAATLALMQTFAFNESAIDADDLKFGPGLAIPVNGDPRDFLYPIQIPALPASGYQEENAIIGDIERTSGISDTVSGGDAGGNAASTATGVQLVQAAASRRIENKTRLLETGVIIPGGWMALELNQRKILESRTYILDGDPMTRPAWRSVEVGPNQLRGRMEFDIEGGSTAAENVPQRRQDAQNLILLSQSPLGQLMDPRKLAARALELHDFKSPEDILLPEQPQIPAEQVHAFLQSQGVDPAAFLQFLNQGQEEPVEEDPEEEAA